MCEVSTSTWKQGLLSSICAHAKLFHFSGILYIFCISEGVCQLHHEYRVESICSLFSCNVTLASLGLSGVSLEEEQLLAVKAMYDRTCLSTCPLEHVLPNAAISTALNSYK